jgi:hypothetical protein
MKVSRSDAVSTLQLVAMRIRRDCMTFKNPGSQLIQLLVSITTQYNKGTIRRIRTPLNERIQKDLCLSNDYIASSLPSGKDICVPGNA